MKILVYDISFGSSDVIYPIQYYLTELNHSVDMFDWSRFYYTFNSPTILNKIKNKLFHKKILRQINIKLLEAAKKAHYDLLFVIRGEHISSDTLIELKQNIPIIINWSSDDLFNMVVSNQNALKTMNLYDIHFSPRRHLKEQYLQNGAKAFEVIDWYYRPENSPLIEDINRFEYDFEVSFIGSWSKRREYLFSKIKDLKFNLSGWGWKKNLSYQNTEQWSIGPNIGMKEMMDVFTRSKININIFTIENKDKVNPRSFDIAVARGFQLSERTDEILQVFEEGKEIACFSSPEELKDKIEFYLDKNELREKMALSAYKKIIEGKNTLKDRLEIIINKVAEYGE